ncbi:MAG: ABC transporter substrate-binding protein [Romboutsia sp.]
MSKRKSIIKKVGYILTLSLVIGGTLTGCQSSDTGESTIDTSSLTLDQIQEKAKEEGKLASLGMPDSWANWVETWEEIESKYLIDHNDTDMSSAEEIAKMESEKSKPTSDIGDVGIVFGPIAENKDLTLQYKTSYWDEIPDWAKDDNGDWVVGYTGSIAIITDKTKVKNSPKTWEDIKNGYFKVTVGDVTKATQAQNAVLSAAFAYGGDETNIQPGVDFFQQLAKDGRISLGDAKPANIEKGEIEVAFLWDFNALNYADQIDRDRFDITILDEASVMSGYATIINKYAPNPHAAMLAREYILSDEGQINLAKGYARPIRNVELPKEVEEKLLDSSEYTNVKTINNYKAWEETAAKLPQKWQQEVLIHVK